MPRDVLLADTLDDGVRVDAVVSRHLGPGDANHAATSSAARGRSLVSIVCITTASIRRPRVGVKFGLGTNGTATAPLSERSCRSSPRILDDRRMIRELAENANTYTLLGPAEERVANDRYVVWLGPGEHPAWTVVQRLRLAETTLDDEIAEIRALVRSRGRSACTWEVADSATPGGLVERLLELGCVPDHEPVATGMVLRTPLAGHDPVDDVEVRRVTTVARWRRRPGSPATAFGMTESQIETEVARAAGQLAYEGERHATYLAYVDGQPVARATAAFTPHGVLLFGGATLEEARGRGAYRALVAARWQDAVARGIPVLVTHAGAMSRPILERLGFEAVSTIQILLDEAVAGGAGTLSPPAGVAQLVERQLPKLDVEGSSPFARSLPAPVPGQAPVFRAPFMPRTSGVWAEVQELRDGRRSFGHRGSGFGPVAVTSRCGTQSSTWLKPSKRPSSSSTTSKKERR